MVVKSSLNGLMGQLVDELVRQGLPLQQARQEFERRFVVASLRQHDGNFSNSARSLGVHRNTLSNKVATLGIEPDQYKVRVSARRPSSR